MTRDEAIDKAVTLLKAHPGMSTSELGYELFGLGMGRANASMARPAGRVLHEARRRGLVRLVKRSDCNTTLWYVAAHV